MVEGQTLCNGDGCGRPIRWVLTLGGRRMPLDPDPHADGTVIAVTDEHARIRARVLTGAELPAQETAWQAHWVTCPAAADFKRRKHLATPKCPICGGRLHPLAVEAGWTRHPLCGPPIDFRALVTRKEAS